MLTFEDFKGRDPAWCPGCGNFAIRKAFIEAMIELQLEPHQFVVVSGIGQAGKFPHYIRCHTFNGLHGRAIPVATGIKLANHKLKVFVVTGDGDCYGEGGNHLIHAIRRNIDIKVFVHNNQIYGLTKGQASPTSVVGMVTKTQPFGVISEPLNPISLAIGLGASFVARGFAGDIEELRKLIKEAVMHRGFALLDILQPCVTFNKINTYEWYKQRIYYIEKDYDPTNRELAIKKSLEWEDGIPLGIIYLKQGPTFEDRNPILSKGPIVEKKPKIEKVKNLIATL
ncbi:MAG: 2-oxoacid:ferredoxin oxidoreductase subunit beta [Caldimicrobium sp.]|nr:2-oxoacid:ferredoxin oxidoreductase subunit beta [Caldimicrobium sp.]